MLTLTAPEMAALVAGMRVLNTSQSGIGVLTKQPETLTNDFFMNLLDMSTKWNASAGDARIFEGKDSVTGEVKWIASAVDLAFGSNSELRAIAEHYGCSDSQSAFVEDFAAAWAKVMNLDR